MTAIWWIRRDFRLADNRTLQAALKTGPIVPVYIIDPYFWTGSLIRRHKFLSNGLRALEADLRQRGSYLVLRNGHPTEVLPQLLQESGARVIFAEEDFTPYALSRDQLIAQNLPLNLIQGQLVHHPLGIRKPDDSPYTVFTPYSKVWKSLLPNNLGISEIPEHIPTIPEISSDPIPDYDPEKCFPVGEAQAQKRLRSFLTDTIYHYGIGRDYLSWDGTSSLSPYIHFGMLGLRTAVNYVRQAILTAPDEASRKSAQTWMNELIWREFYIHILYHFPHVREGNFRRQYNRIQWRNDRVEFDAWKTGQTGYPIVDAAMRQMMAIGWMHNRARMIVASFLVKDLLIDWRWGERWFMQNLLDGDLAANNGGWQWTAGTGTDAAPYFRIFNPILQSKKFDPNGDYIRKWVPELAEIESNAIHAPWENNKSVPGYPTPIVDHKYARKRALSAYQHARS